MCLLILSSCLLSENGDGILLAEDGKRYSFEANDTNDQVLRAGLKVNFVPEEGKAKDIFILKSENSSFSNSGFLEYLDINKSPVRKGAVVAAGGSAASLLAIFPFLGSLFWVAGFVAELFGVKILSDQAEVNKKLFRELLFAYIFLLVAYVVMAFSIGAGAIGSLYLILTDSRYTLGTLAFVAIVLFLLFGVIAMIKIYKAYNAIAIEYKLPMMKIVAILYAVGIATIPIGIGYLIMVVANVVKAVAYLKIDK